jgi:hypothetical protein
MENQSKKDEIIKEISKLSKVENKIVSLLDKMQEALHSQPLELKIFFDIKSISLNLFKENMSISLRSELWKKYIELLEEAKKVKDAIDDQNSFAIEQIDIAIKALENDLKNFDKLLKNIKPIDIANIKAFESNLLFFIDIQKELSLLNSFAIRINSLRKEIVKTSMKIKTKSNFFTRLANLGDLIFPKRKEKINLLSIKFTNVIDEFTKDYDDKKAPFFVLKTEIKDLQNIAKIFTINTASFTESRMKLSKYWDKIKESERIYKQNQLKSNKNSYPIEEKIIEFCAFCQTKPKKEEWIKKEKELLDEINRTDLIRSDVYKLKKLIEDAKQVLFEEEKQNKLKIIKEEKEEKEEKSNKDKIITDLKITIENLTSNTSLAVNKIIEEKNNLEKKLISLNLSKFESLLFNSNLKKIEDTIEDKKDLEIINTKNLNNIKDVLSKKSKKRVEIKNVYEDIRKELNKSNLDFEKAILLRDLLNIQKTRLDKIDLSLDKLQEEIINLENN